MAAARRAARRGAVAGIDVPSGPAIAVAHSGGYRTVLPWLSDERIQSVVLLDALYGGGERFIDWLEDDPARRLILKTVATGERTERQLEEAGDGDVRARISVDRPAVGHMELVTEVKTIPAVLRSLR